MIDHLARGGTKLGVKADVLSLTPERVQRTIKINGYLLHRSRLDFHIASTSFSLSAFWRFSQLAKKADVIHYHFPWPFMDIVHFATLVKKPTVVTYHSDIIRQKYLLKIYRPLMLKFLGDVSRIVATSPNYLVTSDTLARYKHKVCVIPIGLDKDLYPKPSHDRLTKWRQLLGPKFFLFVGVLRYYKGLHILMDAAQGTTFPIVIVGAGPLEEKLKNQARQLGLRNLHFFGAVPDEDKVALLTLCYAILFPSHLRSEAFGISLLEGAMYGKPMISSEIGTGTTFINIGGETGLVVPPSEPKAIQQAMQHLWEHPVQAAEMGRRAEERYWRHFRADQMARSYLDLYTDLLERHHKNS